MEIPPGIQYLFRNLLQVISPPAVVYVAAFAARSYGLDIPVWLTAIAYTLSWPLALSAYIQLRDWKLAREAAAVGAVLPPPVEYKRFGGIDLIKTITEEFETRILGRCSRYVSLACVFAKRRDLQDIVIGSG